jgi:hypothetical protein
MQPHIEVSENHFISSEPILAKSAKIFSPAEVLSLEKFIVAKINPGSGSGTNDKFGRLAETHKNGHIGTQLGNAVADMIQASSGLKMGSPVQTPMRDNLIIPGVQVYLDACTEVGFIPVKGRGIDPV